MKVFVFLLCAGLFAAVSAFKHADRVDVTILRESYEARERRAIDDVSNMPSSLALSVSSALTKSQSAPAVLRLERHALLQPVLSGEGQRSFLHSSNLMDSAVYTDPSRQAALIVRRNADGQYTLEGSFLHDEEEFKISPVSKLRSRRATGRWNQHRVFSLRRGDASVSFAGDFLRKNHLDQPDRRNQEQNGHHGQQSGQGQSGRGRGKRQAVTTHFLETAFIVDYSEYQLWVEDYNTKAVDELTLYYSYVAQGIAIRYNNVQKVDPTINIQFSVSSFTVLTTSSDASYLETLASSSGQVNASQALAEFFTWLQGRSDIPLADHYATFTAFDLFHTDSAGTVYDISGIAYTGTVCLGSALSITENARNGLTAATAAHEIGHSLSANHDVSVGCDDNDQYIMTTSVRVPVTSADTSNPWFFSTCSVNSFQTYLDGVSCTRAAETTGTTALPSSGLQPGQTLSRDQQCADYHRNETSTFSFCESIQTGPNVGGLHTLCYGMLCSIPERPGFCTYIVPQEYTPCGDGKWCDQGVCVEIPTTSTSTTTTTTPTTTRPTRSTTTTRRTPSTRPTPTTRRTPSTRPTRPTTTRRTPSTRPTPTTTHRYPRLVCGDWFSNRKCRFEWYQPRTTMRTTTTTTTTTKKPTTVRPGPVPYNDILLQIQRWLEQWRNRY